MMTLEWVSVEGHRTARMVGDNIAASVDLDRGAHIFELRTAGSQTNLLYEDPRGLAAHDVGGWYELFPNAGPACVVLDRTLPEHGDARDLPWHLIASGSAHGSSVVDARVLSRCLPLELSRRLVVCDDTSTVSIEETVTNVGPDPCPYLWGHHITFGQALAAGASIDVPAEQVFARQEYQSSASRLAPGASGPLDGLPGRDAEVLDLSRFPPPPAAEMLFVAELDQHRCTVTQPLLGLAVDLEWDPDAFPALWIWMENRGSTGEPFLGETVALALEPQSGHVPALAAALEAGNAPSLEPGASTTAWLRLSLRPDEGGVLAADGGFPSWG